MKQLFTLLLFSLSFCLSYASSIDDKEVNFNTLIEVMKYDEPEAMECCPDQKKDINIRNVKINFEREYDGWLDERFNTNTKKIHIPNNINFINCDFPDLFWYLLGNVEFHGYVTFNHSKKVKAKFKNCVFHKSVWLIGNEVEFIEFINCDFKHGFKMERTLVTDKLRFDSCNFNLRTDSYQDFGKALGTTPRLFWIQYRLDPPMNLIIEHCNFDIPEKLKKQTDIEQVRNGSSVDVNFSSFSNFRFNYNQVNTHVNFDRASVSNHFSLHDCVFEKYIFTGHFAINLGNSMIQWSSIEDDKIAVFSEDTGEVVHKSSYEHLKDELNFKSLVSSYAIFYSSYKLQGDRVSSNKCYTEWKDIETIYLKYYKEKDGSVDTFFLYYMNIFLDFFCAYGTSPTQAIKMSFYAMLIFSCFYFLFPPPRVKNRSYINQIRNYFEYFTKNKGLEETLLNAENFYLKNKKYDEFIKEIRENQRYLPFYFKLFGRQVYVVEQFKLNFRKMIFRGFDNITGKWEEISGKRKLLAAVLYGFIVLFSLLYFFFFRIVEALTLSLNAFSTLGFGDIPVKGTVRYLTILEGFIGWFLLSIFSVSLISQILW